MNSLQPFDTPIKKLFSKPVAALFIAMSFGFVPASSQTFDKPIHKQVLNLGRSEHLMPYDRRPLTVTCWYYAHFMVKEQNDPGNKGAVLIAVAPVLPGHLPRCAKTDQSGEVSFKQWDEEFKVFRSWNGYFAGVKHGLIFLEGSDGDSNSGMPFTAFKPDAHTKVFEDSFELRRPGARNLNFPPAAGDQIILRYLRVASATCSIPKSGETCWSKLKQQTGLTHLPMPRCWDYKGKEAGTAASVIAYPVEVSFFPKPLTRPLGGPVRCYPVE